MLVAGCFALGTVGGASAGVIEVSRTSTPSGGEIGAAVATAASGDTILVAPGTYFENVEIRTKVLTIISLAGPDSTIIDGSLASDERRRSIFWAEPSNPTYLTQLTLEGFTLTGGGGSTSVIGRSGGAIYFNGSGPLRLKNCKVIDNSVGTAFDGRGGGVYIVGCLGLWIDGCLFDGNFAFSQGGAVRASNVDSAVVRGSRFEVRSSDWGGRSGTSLEASRVTIVEDCEFIGSGEAAPFSYGLSTGSEVSLVSGCKFIDHGSPQATRIGIIDPNFRGRQYEFSRNVVAALGDEPGPASPGVSAYSAPVRFAANTWINAEWGCGTGGQITVENNIAYHSIAQLNGHGVLSCNNFWPDPPVIWNPDLWVVSDQLSADPLFCEDSFEITADSPCSEDLSPGACGLIGALPVCTVTPVYLSGVDIRDTGFAVELGWSALSDLPLAGFSVHRSHGAFESRVNLGRVGPEETGNFRFVDSSAPVGSLFYWLEAEELGGGTEWFGPWSIERLPGTHLSVEAFPNPTSGPLDIRWRGVAGPIEEVRIVDVAGRVVRVLAVGEPSRAVVSWDLRDDKDGRVPSGTYFAEIRTHGRIPVSQSVRISVLR